MSLMFAYKQLVVARLHSRSYSNK